MLALIRNLNIRLSDTLSIKLFELFLLVQYMVPIKSLRLSKLIYYFVQSQCDHIQADNIMNQLQAKAKALIQPVPMRPVGKITCKQIKFSFDFGFTLA